jgi:hypothetical protein
LALFTDPPRDQRITDSQIKRCSLGAASFALQELCDHWRDHERRDLETAIAELLAHVEGVDPVLLSRIEQLAEMMIGRDKEQLDHLVGRARELEREDPDTAAQLLSAAGNGARISAPRRLTIDRSISAVKAMRGIAIGLQSALSMLRSHHRGSGDEPPRRSGGRPRQTLRKALLQHLRNGGLSYAAMNKLVVGAAGSRRPAEVRNQLHQAVLGRDVRRIRPYED